ncbi:PAS domain S-box protein [Geobacter sp. FeAm09]|uniref:hybrid sensor histidine kinase/response regulator n=1 Tax=Geobacter sp. FeAm09 TaxID=2597769 RepID=UPI0011EFBBB4|nr:PAS domain S-box protein [Geobacter sp. FeAm09]QEM67126.1 PAS domain S-box protein [Geobacter sp. FeAm09]
MDPDWQQQRDAVIGLGSMSGRKSFFPELQHKIEELEENRELLANVIDSIPNPVFHKNLDGVYLNCNAAFARYLGFSKEEIIGRTAYDLAPRELADTYRRADLELLALGGTQVYEAALRHGDGTLHDVVFYKSLILRANGTVRGLVGVILDITELKRAEKALRESEERFRAIFDLIGDAVFIHDLESGAILEVNQTMCDLFGYSREEASRLDVEAISAGEPPYSQAEAMAWMRRAAAGEPQVFEWLGKRKNGELFWLEINIRRAMLGAAERLIVAGRDISDRKQAEAEKKILSEQLSQAQKIESVGRLAGGIAHDFNNLLTPIIVYVQLLMRDLSDNERASSRLGQIMLAASRAKELTQQLLSFGRKQRLTMRVLDLNTVIADFSGILRRTIRESVEISLHLAPELPSIRADRTQVEQILMNLAINAQDAIEKNGTITIETAMVMLDEGYARHHAGIVSGWHAMLSVTDTGHGMTPETQEKIFEPFFTTKESGLGTGLGLATVYGLVKQHNGSIWVYSEPGRGTVFKIYFPLAGRAPDQESAPVPGVLATGQGRGVILLAEDNEMVRDMASELLKEDGYAVLVAESPEVALKLTGEQHIDLLLSDVVMPRMSGPELYARLAVAQPGLRVLYMSGYTDNVIVNHGLFDEERNFIQKPFSADALLAKVRELLS